MANTSKFLARGTLETAEAALYTVPASTKALVKKITLCNKTATAATATIEFGDIKIIGGASIAANESVDYSPNHILDAADTIDGLAGTATAIDYYISGIEIT